MDCNSMSPSSEERGTNYNLAYLEPVPAMAEPFYEVHGDAAAERGNVDQLNTTIDTFQISPPRHSEIPSCSLSDGNTIESILLPHLESPNPTSLDNTIHPTTVNSQTEVLMDIFPEDVPQTPLSSQQDTNVLKTPSIIEGRRIVDLQYFLECIQAIKHKGFDCTFSNMNITGETRNGFCSTLHLQCKMCGVLETLHTENPNSPMNVNTAMVAGIINTGQGFSQMEELSAVLDMPCMGNPMYQKIHQEVGEHLGSIASDEMMAVAREEAALAVKAGNVDKEGRPMITVVADGAWCKRSYKSKYDALSGVACIVGFKTKKVIYMGVRNSYCSICEKASSQEKPAKEHICYKNWTQSATAMEADIIVDGFKQSVPMYGIVYAELIGDGDSSVMKRLSIAKPYGPDFEIKKIECANHILRNYVNRVKEIGKRGKSQLSPVPGIIRSSIQQRVLRMRYAVTEAIKYRQVQPFPHHENVKQLKEDISNGPSHVFGDHSRCGERGYFCQGPKEGETNLVPELIKYGLWEDIVSARNSLAFHAQSLIFNVSNNIAESFNSVVAKFIGGKRINYALRGSYQVRCTAAVTSYNKGPTLHRLLHKKMAIVSPGVNTKRFVTRRVKRRNARTKRKLQYPPLRKPQKKSSGPDEHYGVLDILAKADLNEEDYNMKKEHFICSLRMTEEQRKALIYETVEQSQNEEWRRQRRKRVTASWFGKICKMRQTTSKANQVKTMLHGTFFGNDRTRYGVEHEPMAIEALEEVLGVKVERVGLVVDRNLSFIAASPDGFIGDDAIVEIKCPASAKDFTPNEAIQSQKIKFCTLRGNDILLKKRDSYYYQVQGQLHITERRWCYFVVWTRKGMSFTKIERDDIFWKSEMEPQLIRFYMDSLLPEILDSRYDRGLPIRDTF